MFDSVRKTEENLKKNKMMKEESTKKIDRLAML
jgi:hypothetical protein